jgi:hypothetical protein
MSRLRLRGALLPMPVFNRNSIIAKEIETFVDRARKMYSK